MAEEIQEESAPSNDAILELNFVPSWARQPASQPSYQNFKGESERPRDRRQGFDNRDQRRTPDRRPRPDDRRRPASGQRPNRHPDRDLHSQQRMMPEHSQAERCFVKVSFIPSRPAIGSMALAIRQSHRAYPLFELALRLLVKPTTHMLILDPMENAAERGNASLFQCKKCQQVFLFREELENHTLKTHFSQFYKSEVVETEPPKGNFLVMARCRLSGTLLGPPNYHAYNERLIELHNTRFSHMSLDSYRQNIESVRDPALIEKWKEETRKHTGYRALDKADAPALTRNEAEREFMEKHAAAMFSSVKRAVLPAEVAYHLEQPLLMSLVRKAFENERSNPFGLAMALRPALRHMGFYFFRTKNRMTFVTAVTPRALDTAHVVPSIAEVIKHLDAHPGCKRVDLVEHLRPGMPVDGPEAKELLSPLNWLVEKGHVIEFSDGALSVPRSEAATPAKKEATEQPPTPPATPTSNPVPEVKQE